MLEAKDQTHERVAAAVGASASLAGAFVGPVWGLFLDVASQVVTAGVAAHGAGASASAVHRVARRAAKRRGAPAAAHALDAAYRARKGDGRALRSAAMLVGRCASTHGAAFWGSLAGVFGAGLSKLAAPLAASRAAAEHAALVREIRSAVVERQEPLGSIHLSVCGAFGSLRSNPGVSAGDLFPVVTLEEAAPSFGAVETATLREDWGVAA
ncbi:MAG TPA: hypothetical protein VGI39_18820 [Polyangiaceae bacterium]|jgi:hypothetical protein